MDYGFGAVFGCPAHDQRDFDFAKKYNLKITTVVKPDDENDDFKVSKSIFVFSYIFMFVVFVFPILSGSLLFSRVFLPLFIIFSPFTSRLARIRQ